MKKIAVFNVFIVLAVIIMGVYYISIYDNIAENIVRLHVISNSNSEEDSKIKLLVRDNVLSAVENKITHDAARGDVINALPDIEKNANDFLEREGIGYSAKVVLGDAEIPRKEYNGMVLPKGNYKAIRVILGEGRGENWWCVAYPPLCFTEEVFGKISPEGEEILKNAISDKSYKMITSDVKYEFFIVELAEKIISSLKR